MNPIKVIIQMMKVLCLLAIALFGLTLILSYFNVELAIYFKDQVLFNLEHTLFGDSIFSVILGVVFVIPFVLMIVNVFIPDINSSKYLSIEDTTGYIHISIKAISDYIKQISMEYEEIESARPKLFYKDGNIEVLLYLSVSSKQSIIGLSEVLKKDICDNLCRATAIHPDNIGKIEVVVENIKIDKKLKVTQIEKVSRMRGKK